MPKKQSPKSKTVKAKSSSPKKAIHSTDADKTRALEKKLAQRDAEIARLSVDNQRLLKETEQRATELQIINNIGQTLTEGLDLNIIAKHVAERLHEVLKVENIAITIHDPNTGDLIVRENYYITLPSFAADRFSLDKFKFLMRLSARGGGRSWVVNTNAEKSWRKYVGDVREVDRTPKSFVALPLLAGGDAIGGIIFADFEKENAFRDLPVRMLETIASNMGTAIQNVRLFDETQRLLKETEQRATELQIINNIGQTLTEGLDLQSTLERVGERLREALKIKSIGIAAFAPNSEHIIAQYFYHYGERIAPDQLTTEKVKFAIRLAARWAGRSWVVNTNAEKYYRKFAVVGLPKSFVMLPLLVGKDVIGGISFADYDKENAFTDLPIGMLETIASNMGTAVQNVRLFDETQRLLKETEQRAAELQVINDIGETLAEEIDLNSLIERVGDRLREALKVESIRITVIDEKTGYLISPYVYRNGVRAAFQNVWQNKAEKYKQALRLYVRSGKRSWVVNTNAEKAWRRFAVIIDEEDVPKSFMAVALLAGDEIIGAVTIADYEKENAFTDFPVGLLEIIASNMGTAIQNARLFDETKKLFKEAEEARAAAEQANKAKSTFLANMSHELRTPLNAIMGFTQIVRGKGEGILPEKQLDNLDKVTSSSQHLLGLINTVLDIAKIEAGRMEVLPSKFNLNGLADQCANLATPLLKPNVSLEKQADESIGIIFSDQDKIKQIVLNLLSNAAKFTHEGKIVLAVDKVDSYTSTQGNSSADLPVYLSPCVRISVKDSGIGISEEAVGRVFEEFQQADNTTTRQYGGTGLGLTISRNLARLLGGDLTATSELGKGSTFTLTIPMNYKIDNASSDSELDTVHQAESNSETSYTEERAKGAPTKTILIVEDTELNINLLAQLLEEDYKLLFAKDGAQGVGMAQQENPDLILMDISLPIMDGYEATRRIRANMTSIPIIGLSAYAMTGDADKAKEAGCNDYVTKPINKDILLKKIQDYLR